MDRRDFLKLAAATGALAVIPPDFMIKSLKSVSQDLYQDSDNNNISGGFLENIDDDGGGEYTASDNDGSGLYSDIGDFLRYVSDVGQKNIVANDLCGGAIQFPSRLVYIFEQAAIKTKLIHRMRNEKFTALFYATQELLNDSLALGNISCKLLCDEIEYASTELNQVARLTKSRLHMDARYDPNDQCFKITMWAV